MNDIEITYYAGVSPLRPKPTTVFRFYNDDTRFPERYSIKDGWVEDRDLLLMKMKGDITDAALISSDDAFKIIEKLTGD